MDGLLLGVTAGAKQGNRYAAMIVATILTPGDVPVAGVGLHSGRVMAKVTLGRATVTMVLPS